MMFHLFAVRLTLLISQIFTRRLGNGIHHRIPHRFQPLASRVSTALLNIRKQQSLIKTNPFLEHQILRSTLYRFPSG